MVSSLISRPALSLCHASSPGFLNPPGHDKTLLSSHQHSSTGNICINNSFSTDTVWHSSQTGVMPSNHRHYNCPVSIGYRPRNDSTGLSRLGSTSSESIMLSKLLMFFTGLWVVSWITPYHDNQSLHGHYHFILTQLSENWITLLFPVRTQHYDLKALRPQSAGACLQIFWRKERRFIMVIALPGWCWNENHEPIIVD